MTRVKFEVVRQFASVPPAVNFKITVAYVGANTATVRYFVNDVEVEREDFRAIQEVCR